jgi:hypothetical protein
MLRFFLAILLVFSTIAVVAHGVLLYHFNSTTIVIANEESSDKDPVVKEGKDLTQENTTFFFDYYRYPEVMNPQLSGVIKRFIFSKGFYDKPYNPPETF